MLALLLAVLLLCFAGWNVAVLVIGPGCASAGAGTPTVAPRLSTCCQIAMSVTVGFTLLTG